MWVYMHLHEWESIELQPMNAITPQTKLANPGDGSIGILAVYDTYENAIKAGCEPERLVEARFVKPAGKEKTE